MKEYLLLGLSLFVLALLVTLFVRMAYVLIKERKKYHAAWKAMDRFERYALQMGGLLFIFIPAVKAHPERDTYVNKVFIEMLPEIASGFLVLGIIAFVKELQSQKRGPTTASRRRAKKTPR